MFLHLHSAAAINYSVLLQKDTFSFTVVYILVLPICGCDNDTRVWFGLFIENNNTDVFAWTDGTELVRICFLRIVIPIYCTAISETFQD